MRKNIYTALIIPIIFTACSVDDTPIAPPIASSYKLVEILADPGDGSGTFETVTSNKQLTFYANGTITSNGNLCQISIDSDYPSTGTYNSDSLFIQSDSCSNRRISYAINGKTLTLSRLCREPCREKYQKIEPL
ncbi:MAG: hypothetical protein COA58_14050 [Bacteroidetes bacterium]|nr:MAG: hypothetical protein COA58_14050 [Bacteroidota bacterium]